MNKIKYGLLHCLTDSSIGESAMTVEQLVETAAAYGAPAIALTDHCSMISYIDFMNICKEHDVKPIVGVEAYVEENNEGKRHLILMAKDYEGFVAISKAVSESYERVADFLNPKDEEEDTADKKTNKKQIAELSVPRMNRKILERNFAPGTRGHGHVIATSACIKGVLASILSLNDTLNHEIDDLKSKQSRYIPANADSFLRNQAKLTEAEATKKDLMAQIAACKKEAGRSTLSLERKLQKLSPEDEAYEALEAELKDMLKRKAEAPDKIEALNAQKEAIERMIKDLRAAVKTGGVSGQNWQLIQDRIDALSANIINDADIDQVLIEEAKRYAALFGKDNFYIELQYHGTPKEKKAMQRLELLSTELSIPVVLSNSTYMPTNGSDDLLAMTLVRSNNEGDWKELTKYDRECYIKTDEELIAALSEVVSEKKIVEGYANIEKIVSECHLEMPKEDHYPKFATPDGSTAEEYLTKMAYAGIAEKFPNGGFNDEYAKRLEHELSVINKMGYADYHCIVEDFLRYARAAGKLDLNDPKQEKLALSFDIEAITEFTRNMPGETVGPGRGSAAGSLVCYLIGITNIDPLKYGLLFEREQDCAH